MIITDAAVQQKLLSAGERLRSVLDAVLDRIAPGVVAADLDQLARDRIRKCDALPAFLGYRPASSPSPYPAALCVSINEGVVHGVPAQGLVIQDGDVVSVDCGLSYDGYFVDAACTVVVGSGDGAAERLVEATRKALKLALFELRAGVRVGKVSNCIETFASEQGFVAPPELGGHGVGLAPHEEPFVPNMGDPSMGPVLQKGQVLAIEPIFFEGADPRVVLSKEDGFTYVTADGSRSAHFEHTVIVTDGAPIIVTGPMW